MRLLKHPLLPTTGMRLLKHPLLPNIGMRLLKPPPPPAHHRNEIAETPPPAHHRNEIAETPPPAHHRNEIAETPPPAHHRNEIAETPPPAQHSNELQKTSPAAQHRNEVYVQAADLRRAQFIVSGVVSSHALSPTPAPLEVALCPCIPAVPLARLSKLTDSALDAFLCGAGPGFCGGPLFLEVLYVPRSQGRVAGRRACQALGHLARDGMT